MKLNDNTFAGVSENLDRPPKTYHVRTLYFCSEHCRYFSVQRLVL